jgi:hypothetical protein
MRGSNHLKVGVTSPLALRRLLREEMATGKNGSANSPGSWPLSSCGCSLER